MRHSVIQRKLGKVDRALDKAIEAAEMPGAVVLAGMQREGINRRIYTFPTLGDEPMDCYVYAAVR